MYEHFSVLLRVWLVGSFPLLLHTPLAGIPRPGKSTGNWFPFLFYSRQFIEPCKQLEWDSKETEIFLGSLVDTCIKLDSLYTYV